MDNELIKALLFPWFNEPKLNPIKQALLLIADHWSFFHSHAQQHENSELKCPALFQSHRSGSRFLIS
ncbi:MAG: hypothetical protein ACLQVY_09985 [Limisphaerales bacterium]